LNTPVLHALAKLVTPEGIELPSLSGRVRTAELSASATVLLVTFA